MEVCYSIEREVLAPPSQYNKYNMHEQQTAIRDIDFWKAFDNAMDNAMLIRKLTPFRRARRLQMHEPRRSESSHNTPPGAGLYICSL